MILEAMKRALTFIESGPHSVQLAADLRAAIEQMENAEPVKYKLFLGDGDPRTARVAWSERVGNGVQLYISISNEPQALEAQQAEEVKP